MTDLTDRQPAELLLARGPLEHSAPAGSTVYQFAESLCITSRQLFSVDLCNAFDAVAAQLYEGRAGTGTVILAERLSSQLSIAIQFTRPVHVTATRAFRKILEMSGPDLRVLCDGTWIYGLGRVIETRDNYHENIFELAVIGRGSWEVVQHGVPLLRVVNARPKPPAERFSREHFGQAIGQLFPDSAAEHVFALWSLVEAAARQERGTMLVVHRNAAAEASRLLPQALLIEPTTIDHRLLQALTSIDGAVLLSPDARCHAVGVILDGKATGSGDLSRGARYNSAIRYRAATSGPCLVIIVSEDGMINLLPEPRP